VSFEARGFLVTKPHLSLVAPSTENRTVTPLRRPNAELRKREHLTADEVEGLMTAAKGNRYGHRDATMVLLAYRHGLRACELVDLEWSQVDFKAAVLHVRRAKKGTPATHPLRGDELRALRKLQRESPASSFVFVSERGSPFSTAGFAKMVERAGAEPASISRHTRTCYVTPAASPSPMPAMTPRLTGGPWAPQHSAYGAVYGAGAEPVQGFLAVGSCPPYPGSGRAGLGGFGPLSSGRKLV
jgi:integrase